VLTLYHPCLTFLYLCKETHRKRGDPLIAHGWFSAVPLPQLLLFMSPLTYTQKKGNHTMSVLDQMHTAMKEAKENSSKGAMLMLTTDGEQRRIRFLYDLDNGANNQAIVFLRHVVYDNTARKYIVDAVCGAEVGQSCRYCTLAQHDKRYIARKSFFLPVFVYEGVNGLGSIKLLELKATTTVLPTLIDYYAEEGSIMLADFTYSRTGAGKETRYTIIPKAPRPFTLEVQKPTEERVLAKILEAFPYADEDTNGSGEELGDLPIAPVPAASQNASANGRKAAVHVPDF